MKTKETIKKNNKTETKVEENLGTVMVLQVLITIALIFLCIIAINSDKAGFMGAFSENDMLIIYFILTGESVLSTVFMINGYLRKDRESSIIGTIIFAIYPFLMLFTDLSKADLSIRTILSIIIAIYSIIAIILELKVPKNKKR